MKWNDTYLPYRGIKKIIIHKYILYITNKIKDIVSPQDPTFFITVMNYIQNDCYWDINIFKTAENRKWFLEEVKTNPYLIDFIITEIEKIIEFPEMYKTIEADEEKKLYEVKSEEFGEKIYSYIKNNPTIPHFYFSLTDKSSSEQEMFDFLKTTKKYRRKTADLPKEFHQIFIIKHILEKFLNISCSATLTNKNKIVLTSNSHNLDISLTNWGYFPHVFTTNTNHKLICIFDEFSIYILGIANRDLLNKYNSQEFLFTNKPIENNQSAFYGFDNLPPFSFEHLNNYLIEPTHE